MPIPGISGFFGGLSAGPPPPSEANMPTYVGVGTQDALAGGTSFTVVRNAGWQAGDYELIHVSVEHAQVIATPSDVDLILDVMPGDLAASYFRKLYVFGRVLEAGSADQAFDRGGVSGRIGYCSHIFRGVYEHDPIDAVSSAAEIGVGMSCPSLTASGPNRMIAGFSSIDGCNSYTNANLANITERQDAVVNDVGMSAWTGERAEAGAIGATTWNGPNADGIAIGMIALRPA